MTAVMQEGSRTRGGALEVVIEAPAWRTALGQPARRLRRVAKAALEAAGCGGEGLCLVLGDDRLLRRLNRDFRGRDKATNVLSFPSGESGFLGDVLLAYETCAREAAQQGKALADHASHLCVHGVLHLLGHDHEEAAAAAEMERLERRILAGLGIADPYVLPALSGSGAAQ